MSIWKYSEKFKNEIKKEFQLSIKEGDTPLDSYPELARKMGLKNLYLKREDKNPTGSHKDRSLTYQLSAYLQQGETEFVISSSGNAAISAISLSRKYNLKLHVYLSYKLSETKIERLNSFLGQDVLTSELMNDGQIFQFKNIIIHIESRPKVMAFRFSKENSLPFLRGSTDNLALEGFKTIAFEIYESNLNVDSIFMPCSSGTTLIGIYNGFKTIEENLSQDNSWQIPQLHIVQTVKVNTIAGEFDKDFIPAKHSLSQAIVDRVGHRKEESIKAIVGTNGSGWVLSDDWIIKGQSVLEGIGVECSAEGSAAMGALLKALDNNQKLESPILLITGKR